MTLMILLTAVLLIAGGLLALLTALYRSPYGATHHIREAKNHGLARAKYWRNAAGNAAMSVVLVYGLTWLLYPRVFHEGPVSVWRSLLEGVAILAAFDFFYYLLHRYPFHRWRLLRRVHAVHHIVRNPMAVDSLYQHPVEDALGLSLLWACAAGVSLIGGPVSIYSFAWVFLVYSLLNVVVHSGLDFHSSSLRLLSYLATRHNKHHVDMNGKNYASVTPLWDMVFGTEEP
jgi:sterol desaturase/sphingolipid hydroxylase (fatty acid hydroxylase superfamily)